MDTAGNDQWSNVPNLNWKGSNRKVKLNANDHQNRNVNWAVPSFRERSRKTQDTRTHPARGCS